ncbi:MAG TPA: glycosyltransferase [Oscillatoriaceae cyanobacterium]
MKRIVIGGPVHQDPARLAEYLQSLASLDTSGLEVDFAFIDDNADAESSALLRSFRPPSGQVMIASGGERLTGYQRNENTHVWTEHLAWRVAGFRNQMIQVTLSGGYDGLFMLDSDLVLHPQTLKCLIEARVDVISEIFWTRWTPTETEAPQVWLTGQYVTFQQKRWEKNLSPDECRRREDEWFAILRRPGVYRVGGLGACTLFSRRTFELGANYNEVPDLEYNGEDRHFCVRAATLGITLYVDTHYPALHLYRNEDLARVPAYRAGMRQRQDEIEALDAFKATLIDWGHSHHETNDGKAGVEGFTSSLREAHAARAEEVARIARETQTVSRMAFLSHVPALIEPGAVAIEAKVLQTGSEGGKPFQDHLTAHALMRREGERWCIDRLEFETKPEAPQAVPFVRKVRDNRVLLSMLVHNEADRYLRQVLSHAASYVDQVLIVDDGSTDDSVEVCREVLAGVPHRIVRLEQSSFHQEHLLRRKQWELALAERSDWILVLDADEIFEDGMRTGIRRLIDQDQYDAIAFRLYDFWDEARYRDDAYWCAHRFHRPFLVRRVPGRPVIWQETDQHCGRFPQDVMHLRMAQSELRLKHLGWASERDRQAKFARYQRLDPDGRFGSAAQYQSILDPQPNLVRFEG